MFSLAIRRSLPKTLRFAPAIAAQRFRFSTEEKEINLD